MPDCMRALQAAGRHGIYAKLLLHAGDQEHALRIWEDLGRGSLSDPDGEGCEHASELVGSGRSEPTALPACVGRWDHWDLDRMWTRATACHLHVTSSRDQLT